MRRTLTLHPGSRCAAATGVEAEAVRLRPGVLDLRFVVIGRIGGLLVPPAAASGRADGLWRHTCFEAFLRAAPDGGYYEFNLSPSTRWQAYRFDGYRTGMRAADGIAAPRIDVQLDGASLILRATLELDGVPGLPAGAVWSVGLAAVLEEADGGLSYWALAHPPGRPDFHHSDCFALELPPA